MTTTRVARCACGQLTFTVRGEPRTVHACSCLECQRRSGSAFSYSAIYLCDDVSIAGESRTLRRGSDSGRWIETRFCPVCGVTVGFEAEGLPGMLGVAVGCFADPDFVPPATLYWASQRHHWLEFPDASKVLDRQPV
jgi:hypothetical protein